MIVCIYSTQDYSCTSLDNLLSSCTCVKANSLSLKDDDVVLLRKRSQFYLKTPLLVKWDKDTGVLNNSYFREHKIKLKTKQNKTKNIYIYLIVGILHRTGKPVSVSNSPLEDHRRK